MRDFHVFGLWVNDDNDITNILFFTNFFIFGQKVVTQNSFYQLFHFWAKSGDSK